MKVFANRLMSKEGQEIYGKTMGQATRRLDVDIRRLTQTGIKAAKDFLTVEEEHRFENYSEDAVTQLWNPAAKFANEILK